MAKAARRVRLPVGAGRALFAVAGVPLVFLSLPATAQDATGDLLVSSAEVSDTGRVEMVVAPPQLLSGQDFPAGAFGVSEAGGEREVEVTPLRAGDLEVVLVLDGTLPEDSRRSAKSAAVELVLALPEQSRIGVVSSAGRARQFGPLSTDDGATLAAIQQVEPAEGRATYNAVELALSLLSTDVAVRRTIVVLSGGPDTASTVSPEYLTQQLAASDTALYPITIGGGDDPVDAPLVSLPSRTNGRALSADEPAEILGRYDEVVAELLSQYRLVFDVEGAGSGDVEIEVAYEEVMASASLPLAVLGEGPVPTGPSSTEVGAPPSTTGLPAGSGSDDNRFTIAVLVIGLLLEVFLIGGLRVLRGRIPARSPAPRELADEEANAPQPAEAVIDLREPAREVVLAEAVPVGATKAPDPGGANGWGRAFGDAPPRPEVDGPPLARSGSETAAVALPVAPLPEQAPQPRAPFAEPPSGNGAASAAPVKDAIDRWVLDAAPDAGPAPRRPVESGVRRRRPARAKRGRHKPSIGRATPLVAAPALEVRIPDTEAPEILPPAGPLPPHPLDRAAVRFSSSVRVLTARLRAGTPLARSIRVAATASSPTTRLLFERLARTMRNDDSLAAAATALPLSWDWRMRWIGLAARAQTSRGGALPDFLDAAAHTIAERARLATQRRRLDTRERLVAFVLPSLPVAIVVARQVNSPFLAETRSTSGGTVLLGLAIFLTAAGTWWLRRVGREPLAPVPALWRAARRRALAEQRLEEVLDRSVLYAQAGLDMDAALALAAGEVPPPLPPLAQTMHRLREEARSHPPAGEGDEISARTHALRGEATRLRQALARRTARQARRVALSAVLPFAACVLPATIIVAFLLP